MQATWAGVCTGVKADADPPDRRKGVVGAAGAMGRRGARRSQSLVPEGASEVRRAGYSIALRQGGFRSLVLGEGLDLAAQHDLAAAFGQDIPVTSPSTLPRRKSTKTKPAVSLHKNLSYTASDPTAVSSKQCTSCGDHLGHCLCALSLFEACGLHDHSPLASHTPRRTHSLLRRSPRSSTCPPRRPSRSLTARHKHKSIQEEGGEESFTPGTPGSEAQTPDSEVCTPEGGTRSPDSSANTPDDNTRHEKRTPEGKMTPRALRALLETRSATLGKEEEDEKSGKRRDEGQQRGGNGIERKADPALLKPMRRLSI
ncbi:uncharacterized protein LOC126998006 isoform X2 [Eriocheir sinensis]|uniref:uncharacterized protein LOC126998006 isoform X2 n=1 Tax=Eriocheir sinensis TaxID=95602 RepID=UPI0021C78068|nr:uncharacterized protein LOC126998006 isoform X2 [Eriocheir sinensis]XP_050715240.1 uncharacterized protein LOC126998006 isoform X2 [Eriocheir sinensis]